MLEEPDGREVFLVELDLLMVSTKVMVCKAQEKVVPQRRMTERLARSRVVLIRWR